MVRDEAIDALGTLKRIVPVIYDGHAVAGTVSAADV